jgi:hypothetical protein
MMAWGITSLCEETTDTGVADHGLVTVAPQWWCEVA